VHFLDDPFGTDSEAIVEIAVRLSTRRLSVRSRFEHEIRGIPGQCFDEVGNDSGV
jgi:hypothetical protein